MSEVSTVALFFKLVAGIAIFVGFIILLVEWVSGTSQFTGWAVLVVAAVVWVATTVRNHAPLARDHRKKVLEEVRNPSND